MTSSLLLARLGLRFLGRSILHLAQNQKVWIVVVGLLLGQVSSLAADLAPGTLPSAGQIIAGTGSIAQAGNVMVVQQETPMIVLHWGNFDVGSAAAVQFRQPGADSIALNRVTGGNPSQILGSLDANGRVFLLNPAGIVFGKTANVNVGGLVASTLSLADTDFLAGRHTFTNSGTAGSIVNQGTITAAPGGVVAFLAPVVRNEGTLRAPGGDVALAAGDKVDVDFAGDGRLRIRIDLSAVDAEVANHGLIKADGGAVVMSAKSADNLTRAVVNNTGIVEATTVANVNGRIVIDTDLLSNTGTLDASGATGGSVAATAAYALNAGTISARGTAGAGGTILVEADRNVQTSGAVFDASGATQGGKISLLAGSGEYNGLFSSATVDARGATGGTITLAGKRIDLRGATLDASGTTAGGSIRVGGELHGGAWTDPITGRTLTNAAVTDLSPGNTLKASATQGDGTGGRIIVWSDQQTYFYGAATAQGAGSGAGGFIEVSGKNRLQFGGTVDASSAGGKAGTVLFDPKNIVIDDSAGGGMSYNAFTNPNPGADTQFGTFLVALANGNMVATDPYATAGGQSHAGAAYLFAPDGTLISTLTGSHINDQIGYDLDNWTGGTTVLTNDNYVISSPAWNGGMGAATWGSKTTGVSGIVAAGNSLVGAQAGDKVGSGGYGAYVLSNGNYVISSPSWSNGATAAVGAVTWGNGTSGVTGTISSANSLIGSSANDAVGGQDVVVLTGNGNYVVLSPFWDNVGLGVTDAGAATWVNGATGQTSNATNTISSANSIVGDFLQDEIGIGKATALTNGNYVVSCFYWHDGANTQVGAATWVNGATGLTSDAINTVSSANSLVGTAYVDLIGGNGVFALSNGNYVVDSPNWGGGGSSVGAVTWGNGATGTTGTVGTANSLLGNTANDSLGNAGVTVLSNGNYVVLSPNWDRGAIADAGAATWQDGSTGGTRTLGATITSTNSLVGSVANDKVGTMAVALRSNGNYVVGSPQYSSGTGAATWVDGSNGHTANSTNTISAANSLIGSSAGSWDGTYHWYYGGDSVGATITALTNGNYVVNSPDWGSAKGAVTWGNGTNGMVGTVSAANSLVGSTVGTFTPGDTSFTNGDKVGSSITALTNGNFVISSYNWSDGGLSKVGAVTWVDGTTGLTGTVSSTNSLVGSAADDRVGYGGITVLANGNYVVGSPNWDNGATVDAGAATWVAGTTGLAGAVDAANSLVGTAGQKLGGYLLAGNGDTFGVGDGINYWGVGIYSVSFAASYTGGYTFADNPADLATLTSSQLTSVLNTGSNLVLQANNDITVTSAITVNNASGNGGALTLQAGRSILLNNSITTDNGALTLVANETTAAGVVNAQRDAGAAVITTAGGTSINAGSGAVSITLKNGAGKTNLTSGDITLEGITSGALTVTNSGPTAGSDTIVDGAVVAPGAIIFTTPNAFTQNAAATITGGTGLISITADTLALNGATNSISGTGEVRLQPQTASRPVVIGAAGTASDFALGVAELATLKDGFSCINLGAASGTGLTTVSGTLNFYDRVGIWAGGVGGRVTLAGDAAITSNGNHLGFFAGTGDGGIFTQTAGATITSGGGELNLVADNVVLDGATNSIQGVWWLYLQTANAMRPIIVGSSAQTVAGSLAFTTAELDTFRNGCATSNIGRSSFNGSGSVNAGGITVPNPVTFYHSARFWANGGGATIAINANTAVEGGTLDFSFGGPIQLNANLRGSAGVSFQNSITVNADNLAIDAGTGSASFYAGGYTVNHGAHDFTITANSVDLNGNWTGTGARILQPTTGIWTIGLAGGAGAFALDATELGYLSNDSPSSVTIGRSGGTGAITGGAFSFDEPLNLRGGTITQTGAWTLDSTSSFAASAGNSITLTQANDFGGAVTIVSGNQVSLRDANALVLGASTVSGDLTLQTGGALTQTGDLAVAGTTSLTAGATDITFDRVGNDFGGAVSIVSGKIVTLRDATALALGAVTATGTVDIATLTGDLTLTGAVATTDSSADAIKLNAGRTTAAGTATGGNILVSGGSVSTGAGGFATLYTGSISGSTGLTALLGSGSGRFRYNSDESTTGYSTALSAGINAIYREQPIVTVTPSSGQTITYGTSPTSAYAHYGYVNGDSATSTSGTIAWSVSGTVSTAGYATVGVHDIAYSSGLSNGLGYAFANDAGSTNELTVTPRSLAVTGLTADNKTYDATNVATLGGTATISALAADVVTLSGTATGTFADKNFGAGKAVTVVGNTISGTDATNYTLVQQTGLTADIAKAALTISSSDVVKNYDGGTSALGTATVASGTLYDSISGGSFAFTNKNAGSGNKTVTVSGVTVSDGNSGNNYAVTYADNNTSTINPLAVTLTAGSVIKTYDGTTGYTETAGDLTNLGSVLVGGDSVTAATITYANKNAGAGNKTVTLDSASIADGNSGNNYTVTLAGNATSTIDQAALTISSNDVVKTYDGGTSALGTATVASGTLYDSLSGGSFAFTNKNASSGDKTVTVSGVTVADGNSGNNYAVTYANNTTSTINPLAVTLTAGVVTKTYDGTTGYTETAGDLSNLGSVLVGGDTVTAATITYANKNAGAGNKTVALDSASISDGNSGNNYTVTLAGNATSTISQAALTISSSNVVKTYDGGISALGTATVTSGTLYDSLSGGSFAFTNKNASSGNKTVTVTGVTVADGNSGNNYAVSYANNTTSTINPATLTVGYTGVNRVYDTTTGATVTTSDDRLGADILTINRTAAFTTKDVANGKTVNVTGVSLSGTDAGNYIVAATGSTTANITPATLTVGYTGVNRVYDATTGAIVTTIDDRLGSDALTINRTAAFTTKDVANGKTVAITGVSLSGTDAGNYTVAATGSTTANITPATLTVGYTGVNRVYDATTGATVTTSDNRLGSDALTVNRTAAFTTKDVANGKTVNVTGVSLSGTDALNYTVAATGSTTANITPATLTVGYTGVNRVYDATTGATVTTSDNRLGGDVLTINRTAAFTTKDVANGKTVNVTGVSLTGTDSGNYAVAASGSTTANITPATLTVTGLSVNNKVYDGTTSAVLGGSGTITALGSDVVTLDGSATAAFVDKNVGTGKIVAISGLTLTGADAGNYTIASTGSALADITAKALTATFTAADKVYDGTTAATLTGNSFTGLLGTETVGATNTAATFDTKDVGTGKTVTISGIALTNGTNGGLASNYTLAATATTAAAITPATLTYVAAPAEASSPVVLPTLSGTVTGFVQGDTFANATTGTALWTSNVTTGSFTGNYAINGSGLAAGNYVFVQAAGNATALFLQPVNPVVTDTPRVEPFIRIDGRNQGEIYPFEGGSIGIERSALFVPLVAPVIDIIDQPGEEDEASPALTMNPEPATTGREAPRSAEVAAGAAPVAALVGSGGALRYAD